MQRCIKYLHKKGNTTAHYVYLVCASMKRECAHYHGNPNDPWYNTERTIKSFAHLISDKTEQQLLMLFRN